METVITVNPSELNSSLLNEIKKFIGKKINVDVVISLREYDPAYVEALDKSIEQAETNSEIISLSMEDFVAYAPQKG
jgi:dienelactone hydrolase